MCAKATSALAQGLNATSLFKSAMTTHRVVCPFCREPVAAGAKARGRMKCPHCQGIFVVRSASAAERQMRRAGRFDLLKPIGQGGFGTVWKARDLRLDRHVALKILDINNEEDPEEWNRFEREAKSTAQLNHPGIVPVYEVLMGKNEAYIVSEYVDGSNLGEYLSNSQLTYKEVASITLRLAEALAYSHSQGVIHRDLKPSNILVPTTHAHEGKAYNATPLNELNPRITDFGIAKHDTEETRLTVEGQILGTPAYMSPEQIRDAHQADAQSDIYSLGIVLYEMLVGEVPFRGIPPMVIHQALNSEPRPPRAINHTIPPELETICLKCIRKDAQHRYRDANALARDLRLWLGGHNIDTRPMSAMERTIYWAQRNPSWGAAAGVLLIVIIGAILLIVREQLLADSTIQDARATMENAKQMTNHARQQITRAEEEREFAKQNLEHVREAVGSMMHILSEAAVIDDPQLADLKASLLGVVLDFYTKSSPSAEGLNLMSQELSETAHQLGYIQGLIGQPSQGVDTYGRAIDLWQNHIKANNHDDRTQMRLRSLHAGRAALLTALNQFEEAQADWQHCELPPPADKTAPLRHLHYYNAIALASALEPWYEKQALLEKNHARWRKVLAMLKAKPQDTTRPQYRELWLQLQSWSRLRYAKALGRNNELTSAEEQFLEALTLLKEANDVSQYRENLWPHYADIELHLIDIRLKRLYRENTPLAERSNQLEKIDVMLNTLQQRYSPEGVSTDHLFPDLWYPVITLKRAELLWKNKTGDSDNLPWHWIKEALRLLQLHRLDHPLNTKPLELSLANINVGGPLLYASTFEWDNLEKARARLKRMSESYTTHKALDKWGEQRLVQTQHEFNERRYDRDHTAISLHASMNYHLELLERFSRPAAMNMALTWYPRYIQHLLKNKRTDEARTQCRHLLNAASHNANDAAQAVRHLEKTLGPSISQASHPFNALLRAWTLDIGQDHPGWLEKDAIFRRFQ